MFGNMRFGLMGSPMAPAYGTSFDSVGSGGGMDVLGSLKQHSDYATRFASNPTGGSQMVPGYNGFGMSAGMNYGGF